ncbi:MAG TPA: hypothetical protein VLA09_05425 [Longimicrobiales bacterium]|nr:hypothetical protein [Longimicrobiales bacterium]
MTKRPKTRYRPRSKNEVTKRILDVTAAEAEDEQLEVDEAQRTRQEARAEKLGLERREIVRRAATAEWENEGGQ